MNSQCIGGEAGNLELRQMTTRLMRGENLSRSEAADFLEALLNPSATDTQLGSRAATSSCGSADVLEALGVNTAASPETVQRCLNEHGICFMFASIFHRTTARVAHVRRELGVRTSFNLLGPLTNPARAPFQILGVWHRSLLERVASALSLLGVEKAWVVHGADGLDEITITGRTFVAACLPNR